MEYPPSAYITIETYYEGSLVDDNYFNNNPDLFINYPNKSEVNSIISEIRNTQKDGVKYCIKIYESGISVSES